MADSEGRTKVAEIKNRSVDSRGQSSHKMETSSDGDGTERAKCMRICPIDLNRSPDRTEDGHASVSDRAAFLIDLNRSPERPTEDGETSSASVLANVSTTRFLLDLNKPPERTEDGETEKEIYSMLDDAGDCAQQCAFKGDKVQGCSTQILHKEPQMMVPTSTGQRLLPDRKSRYKMNPKYQSSEFTVYDSDSFLHDVRREARASSRRRKNLVSRPHDSRKYLKVVSTTGSNKHNHEEKKLAGEKDKGPSLACVPILLVFRRLGADLKFK